MRSIGMAMTLAALAGCAGRGELPVGSTGDPEFDAVWTAAARTLREYGFRIDRADPRSGLIDTYPMTGRYWLEFWRRDAVAPKQAFEGALHTMYRRAVVTIGRGGARTRPAGAATRPAGAGGVVVAVRVEVSRSNRPAGRVTSASEAYEMFLDPDYEQARTPLGERIPGGPVPLGRDEKLEEKIRRRILRRGGVR